VNIQDNFEQHLSTVEAPKHYYPYNAT